MKQHLLNLRAFLTLCMIFVIGGGSLALAEEYSFTIIPSDFNTTSYAANNGTHTSTARCTTDNTKTLSISWYSNQIMLQSSVMQWQKNNAYIYNTTDLGTIKSVTVNSSSGTFTTYYGTSSNPSSGTTVGGGYFKVKVGSATGKTSSVVVTFEKSESPTATLTGISVTGTAADLWTGDEFTHDGIIVTATYDDASTVDVTNSCTYNCDMSTAGEQTVTVTYGEKTATYTVNVQTIGNTKETAYTATQAIELIEAGKGLKTPVYVKGKVSNIAQAWTSTNGYLSFWVSEDGTENKFEMYKNYKDEGNVKYASADECPAVGDEVICCGLLTKYNSTYELNAGNYLVEKKVSTDPTTNTLTITPGTSTFTKATDITMSATIEGTKIYYTTDGTEPSESSNLYEGAFKVTKTGTTVKAVAIVDGYDNVTAEATYTIKPDQPVFSEESKIFKDAFDVTLSLPETTDATSTIHYAIGSTATAESDVYTGAINISSETDGEKIILHAVVVDEYGNVGKEKYCTYTKTTATVFDFTQRPNVWNIEPTSKNSSTDESNVVGKELAVDGIVMTSTNGDDNITCIYASSATATPNLRVYEGGTITFTAPEGYNLSEIKFTGSGLGKFICYTYNYSTSTNTWTGNAHTVEFYADAGVQVKTASIKLVPVSSPVTGTLTLVAQDSDEMYYATFSSDKDVVFTKEVVVSAVTVSDNKLSITDLSSDYYEVTDVTVGEGTGIVEDGYYVPANNGVLVSCTDAAAKYYFPKTEDETVTITQNQLKPAPANGGEFTAEDGYQYYKLAYNDYDAKTGLGFYWGAADGGAFSVKAGTAYLAVPTSKTTNVKGFSFDGGVVTGISSVNVESNRTKTIYNIAGQRVYDMTKPGMYIVDGKKVVVK